MTKVFFASFPLYVPLSSSYMHIIFPFKEFFGHLFKCVAYVFCFSIDYSHVSIFICKHFAMFLCTIKEWNNKTIFFYTERLFHYFETDELCYKIRTFTKPRLLISYRFKSEGLLSSKLKTFTYLELFICNISR